MRIPSAGPRPRAADGSPSKPPSGVAEAAGPEGEHPHRAKATAPSKAVGAERDESNIEVDVASLVRHFREME